MASTTISTDLVINTNKVYIMTAEDLEDEYIKPIPVENGTYKLVIEEHQNDFHYAYLHESVDQNIMCHPVAQVLWNRSGTGLSGTYWGQRTVVNPAIPLMIKKHFLKKCIEDNVNSDITYKYASMFGLERVKILGEKTTKSYKYGFGCSPSDREFVDDSEDDSDEWEYEESDEEESDDEIEKKDKTENENDDSYEDWWGRRKRRDPSKRVFKLPEYNNFPIVFYLRIPPTEIDLSSISICDTITIGKFSVSTVVCNDVDIGKVVQAPKFLCMLGDQAGIGLLVSKKIVEEENRLGVIGFGNFENYEHYKRCSSIENYPQFPALAKLLKSEYCPLCSSDVYNIVENYYPRRNIKKV